MSQLGSLPGRLKGCLRAFLAFAGARGAWCLQGSDAPDRARDAEPEHIAKAGERLEQGLEKLKDIQWQMRENEARYRDLLDNQADVILRRDAEGRITFVNQAFCRVFGLERNAVLGQPFQPRAHAGDKPSPPAAGDMTRKQRYVQEIETVAGPRWFDWEEHIVASSEGTAGEVQCLGRDITEARRAEAELTKAHRQAETANRAKSRFLAAMSHEIRTPMNGILGMIGLLAETELSPEQQTYTGAIERSARTLLSLIDEILDFSKIEAGKVVLKSAPLAIDDCVQAVVELLAPKAYEKGIDIAWAIDPSLPRTLIGDEVRLRQIVTNLVGNAIKFTDGGGVLVTVARLARTERPTAGEGVAVAIEVDDTGIGIASEELPFLFQEFEQAEAAGRLRQGGAGLGLAISRRLARAMAGDIVVASEPERGSTFTAVICLEPAAGPQAPQLAMEAQMHHVLLVSDRSVERRALTLTLEGAGVPVEASPIAEAGRLIDAAAAAGEPFTTVLVDGSRDRETAATLLARARAAMPQRCVQGIVVLDTGARLDFPAFRAAGFDAYLVRPVRPQTMLAGIRTGFAEAQEPAPLTRLEAGPERSSDKTVSVLLVEDDDVNALLARRVLEKAGCDVRTCGNGRDAVEAFRQIVTGTTAPVDLVLMDVHMPMLDGLEACRAIRHLHVLHRREPPPIIAVTANAFEEDRRLCLDAGMDDYLAKPFDRDDLTQVLERWCGKRMHIPAA